MPLIGESCDRGEVGGNVNRRRTVMGRRTIMSYFVNFLLKECGKGLCRKRRETGRGNDLKSETEVVGKQLGPRIQFS